MKRLLVCLVSPSFLLAGAGCNAPLEGYFDVPETFEIRIAAPDDDPSALRIGLFADHAPATAIELVDGSSSGGEGDLRVALDGDLDYERGLLVMDGVDRVQAGAIESWTASEVASVSVEPAYVQDVDGSTVELHLPPEIESAGYSVAAWHDADGDELLDLPHEVAVIPRAGRDGEAIYLDSLIFDEGDDEGKWFGTASGFDASGGRFRQIILNAQDARGWEASVGAQD
jgi:hypothetical protein